MGVVGAQRKRKAPKRRNSQHRQKRSSRENGRRTTELLLKLGREELERVGVVDFKLDRVLRRAETTYSSFYHHFGNRDGFLAALAFERSYDNLKSEIDSLRAYIESSDDPRSILRALEFIFKSSGTARARDRRRHRLESLTQAHRSPGLRRALADAQREGTNLLVEVMHLAAEKSGMSPRQPIPGFAYILQSLLFGRALVDLVDDQELEKQWVESATAITEWLFGS